MTIFHQVISVKTHHSIELISLDQLIQSVIDESHIQYGHVLVFSRHTTTALTVNENEERLLVDIQTY